MSTKMRHDGPSRPRIAWKTLAVTAKDPTAFAAELQTSLQELTDTGFNIVSQVTRDGAIIITGQRVEMDASAMNPFATMQPPGPPPQQHPRRIVQGGSHVARAIQALPTMPTSEVLYHYKEMGKDKQRAFPNMLEALRLVQTHLGDVSNEPCMPVCLVSVSMTQYELVSFPALLKAYAQELRSAPAGKPLE